MSRLVFLHLADVHFREYAGDDPFDADRSVRDALEIDLKKMIEEIGSNVDAILLGGDIAFSGKNEQFIAAADWVDRLCDLVGTTKRNQVWVVPGNHDVDRSIIDSSQTLQKIHEDLRSARNDTQIDFLLARYLRDDPIGKAEFFRAIQEFNTFSGAYDCVFDSEHPYWENDFVLNDGSIFRLRGLNSTLVSDGKTERATSSFLAGRRRLCHRARAISNMECFAIIPPIGCSTRIAWRIV